jgi:dCTP deaminase
LILSNSSIVQALNDGRLIIDPRPGDPGTVSPSRYDTTSVNLTLDSLLKLYNSIPIPPGGHSLPSGKLVLGQTIEYVELPLLGAGACLAARVEGKSSLARYGLIVHFTAPTIHAGFSGQITLEMINLGAAPIRLVPGMPICQLVLEQVEGDPVPADSQFQGQRDPSGRGTKSNEH